MLPTQKTWRDTSLEEERQWLVAYSCGWNAGVLSWLLLQLANQGKLIELMLVSDLVYFARKERNEIPAA